LTWDDSDYVLNNPFIRKLDLGLLKSAFLGFYAGNWHPLTWISHAVDYAFWGFNPLGHHLTNVILHCINTFLVVILILRLVQNTNGLNGQGQTRAMIAGSVTCLLFGLHPIHVESVAWISERKDLLCAFFCILSSIQYTNYVRSQRSTEANGFSRYFSTQYLAVLGFFSLALMSKPMAVTLPIVFLILDWYPLGRIRSFRTLLIAVAEKLPLVALSLVSSILTMAAQQSVKAVWSAPPLFFRISVAAQAVAGYLMKMILPVKLLPFYPYPLTLSPIQVLPAVLLIAGLTIACIITSRRRPFLLAAWLYYLVTLFPVLGIVQAGGQSMADRYTYLPSLGPFLLVGLGAAWTADRSRNLDRVKGASVAILAAIVVGGLYYGTIKQISVWKDDLTLWNYTISVEPNVELLAYYNRGFAYAKSGLYDKAIEDYNRVIQLNYKQYSRVYATRGIAYWKTGQSDLAMEDFQKACELGDGYGCYLLQYYKNQPKN
jgi:hypothetical protein